jgi:6-phosphogluconolactonase
MQKALAVRRSILIFEDDFDGISNRERKKGKRSKMSQFSACLTWLRTPCLLAGYIVPMFVCVAGPTDAETVQPSKQDDEVRVYIGTYTGPKSKGIYVCRLNLNSGRMTSPELAADADNPSFLAIHPSRRFLYAASETDEFAGKKSGAVVAFGIQENGKLTLLNQQPSGGEGPCHLVVDNTGKDVLVANYGGGSVSVVPIKEDGRLGEPTAFVQHKGSSVDRERQEGPHAHSVNVDSANRFAFAADLGLDKVLIYRFDPVKGTLSANDPPSVSVKPGAGPRHFAFHPRGHFAYVINEMQSTVTAFSYDASSGALTELQTISTLPENFKGENSTAEVQVLPSGKFLYGSNRGHDSIAIFSIDPAKGTLRLVGHQSTQGKTPRNFGIDPSGRYLLAANQDSGSVVVFRIDPQTGRLSPTGQVVEVPSPVCVKFVK